MIDTIISWNRFQSLIGTVQQQCLLRFMFSLYLISTVFQSFSPKKSVNLFIVNSRKALILLAFLFLSKLARRFTDFSAAFLLFSALFHAVFVLEALILLPWRFTDFFYRFFNNLCFNQRKSSSPLTKTEAPFWISQSHLRSGLRRTSMSFTYILPPGR